MFICFPVFVCMCMCVCMYVCVYACVCMCVCIYVCMYVCVYMYLCMFLCMCVYICLCVIVSEALSGDGRIELGTVFVCLSASLLISLPSSLLPCLFLGEVR